MDDHPLLAGLNREQREAVVHGEGPALVLAGPGSGKTRVITHRIAYLLSQGVPPTQILAVTFTNRAAGEMRARVESLVGRCGVLVTTFHSFCARLLRRSAPFVGLKENYSILDRTESLSLMKQIVKGPAFRSYNLRPAEMLHLVSRCKRDLVSAEEYGQQIGPRYDPIVRDVYAEYQQRLQVSNAVDFDDLLFHVARMLGDQPHWRSQLDAYFRFVMVDEYQDTNEAQFKIVRMLAHDYPNLMVTGDPDQSIYGWRGASIRNILDFQRYYPQSIQIRLEQNYRSTPNILRVADQLIARNSQRLQKTLRTEQPEGRRVRVVRFGTADDEADGVADAIAAGLAAGRRPSDFAVFYRANHLSRRLERAIRRRQIPYQVVRGTEFYQRKEVKDILSYLQLIHNPDHDEALKRIINVPARRIGKVTVSRLIAYATEQNVSLWETIQHVDRVPSLGARSRKQVASFCSLLESLIALPADSLASLVTEVVHRTKYLSDSEELASTEDMAIAANVDELVQDAAEFESLFDAEEQECTLLEAFLQHAALVSDQDRMRGEADAVSLMTLHAAKGLEFPVVFIVAVEEGVLPHERSRQQEDIDGLEEERRLFFVGITRAKSELQISCAMQRGMGDSLRFAVVSPFLQELPREEMEIVGFGSSGLQVAGDEFGDIPRPITSTGPQRSRQTRTSAAMVVPASAMQGGGGHVGGASPDADYEIGDVVSHPEYGVGKVRRCSGSGRNATIEVQFGSQQDARTFRLAFAPLTRIRAARAEGATE